MVDYHTPDDIRAPFAKYSHGVEVPAGARLLFCSGQLGISPDEAIPDDAGAQTELCFENISSVLTSAGMTMTDLIRINAFVTRREHLQAYMAIRDRYVSLPAPASTLMIVSGFARPEFCVEVEVIAARV